MPNALTKAQTTAVTDAQPKLRALARQMCPRGGPDAIDDLTSVGNIALMRKVSQFDPKVGSLYNYAKEEVMREMRRAMRRFSRKDMGVGINDTSTRIKYTADYASDTYRDDGEKLRADFKEVLPPATGPSPEDACLESERGKILRNVLSTLTPREHLVIRRRFFAARECTQKELAEEMGISRQLVELTEYQALMKLREALGDDAEELLG